LANLITRLRYPRNPSLPTPAACSFIHFFSFSFFFSSFFFFSPRSFSPASFSPDRIFGAPSNADYKPPGFMSIPGIGLGKKGRDATMFFFRLLAILATPVSFVHRRAVGLSRLPDKSSSRERIRDGYRRVSQRLQNVRRNVREHVYLNLKIPVA